MFSAPTLYMYGNVGIVPILIGWAVQWFGHLVRGLCKGEPFSEAVNNLDT